MSAQVDQGDVGLVERLEVPGHEGWPLLTEALALGDQPLRRLGIVHDAADLRGDELAPLGVGVGVRQQVQIVAGELGEPWAVPHLLVEAATFVLGVLEGGPIVGRVVKSVHGGVEDVAELFEAGPELGLLARA